MTTEDKELRTVQFKLTLTEWGVVASLLTSCSTALFILGVVYGDVRENTRHRQLAEATQAEMRADIAEIRANVNFLTDLAREERERNR